ncbi:sulfotransferase family 2 domain-containing protein [Pseudoalteromonas lipolytica]
MRKVVLHIGMHKTGSSSIQGYLYQNRDKLRDLFCYPDLGTPNHSGPLTFICSDKPEFDPQIKRMELDKKFIYKQKAYYEKLIDESLKSNFDLLILSAESLTRFTINELIEFKRYLLGYVESVEVYAYVRNPEAFMASAFQQRIKTSFQEITSQDLFPNYKARFEKFEKVFGNVNYRLFSSETLLENDVVNDFCEWINIPYTGFQRVNESLSNASVKFLYFMQKYRKSNRLSQKELTLIENAFSVFNDESFSLPTEIVEANISAMQPDIGWMQERLHNLVTVNNATIEKKSCDSFITGDKADYLMSLNTGEVEMLKHLFDNQAFSDYVRLECGLSLEKLLTLSASENFRFSTNGETPNLNPASKKKTKFLSSAHNAMNLELNSSHQFGMDYAMQLFHSNAVCTFIPKNGCSTLRLSVAIENGCINGIEQGHWIHKNNQTFKPTLKEAATAQYKFVVLRCPFRRLASVFLDKFVAKEMDAWQYRDLLKREIELDDLTFEQFVKSLSVPPMKGANIHWKPQSMFLLYQEYDDYFALEDFDKAIATLKDKINFDIVDARDLTGHGTNKFELLNDDNFSQTPAFDIATLKRQGKCPAHKVLYTDELVELVRTLYADDISLYIEKFGPEGLLFN